MNDLDPCLEVVSRSRQPLRYIWYWISRKPLEIEAWFQRTTNRKWHGLSNGHVTSWPMTLRDFERSNSWHWQRHHSSCVKPYSCQQTCETLSVAPLAPSTLLRIIKVATAFHSYFSKASFQKITRFYLLRQVGGHWTSVPAICCSTETDRSTVPSEDVWLSGVLGGKSVSLECITGQSER